MVVNTLKISFCADHSWREKRGPSESSGGGEGGEGCGVGWGGVGEKRKIGITHKREEERGRCFLPLETSALSLGTRQRQYKKRYVQQTRAKQRGEEKKKKKRSDNNLLFVVTVTKLVMKPEPGSSCLSGCPGRGLGAVSGEWESGEIEIARCDHNLHSAELAQLSGLELAAFPLCSLITLLPFIKVSEAGRGGGCIKIYFLAPNCVFSCFFYLSPQFFL